MPRSVNETNPREDDADPSTENDPRSPTPQRRKQSSRTRTLTEKGELFSYALLSGLLKAYLAHNDKMENYIKNFDIESTNTAYLAACIPIYDTYYETFLGLNEDIVDYLNRTGMSDVDNLLEEQELRFQCKHGEANAMFADEVWRKCL